MSSKYLFTTTVREKKDCNFEYDYSFHIKNMNMKKSIFNKKLFFIHSLKYYSEYTSFSNELLKRIFLLGPGMSHN